MNKKQELKLVFEFIAEYLKDELEIVSQTSIPKVEEIEIPLSKAELAKKKIETLINPDDVRHLMKRVDEMDKQPTFSNNPIIGDQQRNFEAELKKVVKQVDVLTKEKEKDDNDNELDAMAKSDFNLIKNLRNNVSDEEKNTVISSRFSFDDLINKK